LGSLIFPVQVPPKRTRPGAEGVVLTVATVGCVVVGGGDGVRFGVGVGDSISEIGAGKRCATNRKSKTVRSKVASRFIAMSFERQLKGDPARASGFPEVLESVREGGAL
jgi:hypothetical protein